MFLKVLLTGIVSTIGVLLLEQYILLTREPVMIRCDAGEEAPAPPDDWIDQIEKVLQNK